MTVKELIEQLSRQAPEAEVIVLWHGYQRDITSAEPVQEFVILVNQPRLEKVIPQ